MKKRPVYHPWLLLGTVGLTLLLGPIARAATPSREIELAENPGTFDKLEQVLATWESKAAISDVAGKLIIGHYARDTRQIDVYALDEQGRVKPGEPRAIVFPKQEKWRDNWHSFPEAITVHPELPLLYVWQDLLLLDQNRPINEAEYKESSGFHHLLVYDISGDEPKLLQNAAHGTCFVRGTSPGDLAIDAKSRRLFVPNLRYILSQGSNAALGYLQLDEAGLAKPASPDAVPKNLAPGVTQPEDDIYSDVEVVVAHSSTFRAPPAGLNYSPVTSSRVILASSNGPVTWDLDNRRGEYLAITWEPYIVHSFLWRVSVHPEMPVVFVSHLYDGWIYRIDHADGYLTMLPQRGRLVGAKVASKPVILTRRKQFACGGENMIHLIDFDDQGWFTGKRTDVPIAGKITALAYSVKYDRLYVGVEKMSP